MLLLFLIKMVKSRLYLIKFVSDSRLGGISIIFEVLHSISELIQTLPEIVKWRMWIFINPLRGRSELLIKVRAQIEKVLDADLIALYLGEKVFVKVEIIVLNSLIYMLIV